MSEKMPERIVARKSGYWGLDAPARPGRDWVGEYVRADLLAAAEAALKVERERVEKWKDHVYKLVGWASGLMAGDVPVGKAVPVVANAIAALALDPKPSTPEEEKERL